MAHASAIHRITNNPLDAHIAIPFAHKSPKLFCKRAAKSSSFSSLVNLTVSHTKKTLMFSTTLKSSHKSATLLTAIIKQVTSTLRHDEVQLLKKHYWKSCILVHFQHVVNNKIWLLISLGHHSSQSIVLLLSTSPLEIDIANQNIVKSAHNVTHS